MISIYVESRQKVSRFAKKNQKTGFVFWFIGSDRRRRASRAGGFNSTGE